MLPERERLLKRIYDGLEVVTKRGEYKAVLVGWVEEFREFLRLYEDGFTWEDIKKHLEKRDYSIKQRNRGVKSGT